jgi:hypothetical protein
VGSNPTTGMHVRVFFVVWEFTRDAEN